MAGASEVKAGGAYVEIGGRTGKLDTALAASRQKLQSFSAGVSSVGKAFVAAGAAMALPLGLAINKAGDYQEVLSKFRAVFKELAPHAEAWAIQFSEKMGRSRSDVVAFMATLQDTFVPLGFARDRGMELSKTLTQLTVDLASFNNQAEPEVLRDLQSALVGNHETVRKYGIIITQAALDQELMRSGMAKSAREATEQQKVMARLNIIMKGTSDAQGDAERTAGSWANMKRRLFAQIENVAIAVGDHLLPVATRYLRRVGDIVKSTVIWVRENGKVIIGIAKTAKTLLATGAALLVVAGAARVVAVLLSPAGAFGVAVLGILMVLDAIGLLDAGLQDFVGRFRIGSTSIETYTTIMGTAILEVWDTIRFGVGSTLDWIVTMAAQAWITIISGAMTAAKAINEAYYAARKAAIDAGLQTQLAWARATGKSESYKESLRSVADFQKRELTRAATANIEIIEQGQREAINRGIDEWKNFDKRREDASIELNRKISTYDKVRWDAFMKDRNEDLAEFEERLKQPEKIEMPELEIPSMADVLAQATMPTGVGRVAGAFSAIAGVRGVGIGTTDRLLQKANVTLEQIEENTREAGALS